MTQELLRDDSLPYREAIMRPGEALAWAFEWVDFLSNRWHPGIPFASGFAVRPGVPTGYEYIAGNDGVSGRGEDDTGEPAWPTVVGASVQDGSLTWTCQAPSSASLNASIQSSAWVADAGLTAGSESYSGTRTSALIAVAADTPDSDLFVRNMIALSSGETKKGTLLIRVRAGTA